MNWLIALTLVVSVHDGDTVKLDDGRTIRLAGIDAPEISQPYGVQSRDQLKKLVRKDVTVIEKEKDRYGRTVAEIYRGKRSVNREMVNRGAAWWFRKYAPDDDCLRSLEASARKHKRGLWRSPTVVAPWDWRKEQREQTTTR